MKKSIWDCADGLLKLRVYATATKGGFEGPHRGVEVPSRASSVGRSQTSRFRRRILRYFLPNRPEDVETRNQHAALHSLQRVGEAVSDVIFQQFLGRVGVSGQRGIEHALVLLDRLFAAISQHEHLIPQVLVVDD